MDTEKYSVFFSGKLMPGFNFSKSIEALKTNLKIDNDKIRQIVSSTQKPIAQNISNDKAEKLIRVFEKCGLSCYSIKKIDVKQKDKATNDAPKEQRTKIISADSEKLIIKQKIGLRKLFRILWLIALNFIFIILFVASIFLAKTLLHILSPLFIAFVIAVPAVPICLSLIHASDIKKIRMSNTLINGSVLRILFKRRNLFLHLLIYFGSLLSSFIFIINSQSWEDYEVALYITLPYIFLVTCALIYPIVNSQSVQWLVRSRTVFFGIIVSSALVSVVYGIFIYAGMSPLHDASISLSSTKSDVSIVHWFSRLVEFLENWMIWALSIIEPLGGILYNIKLICGFFANCLFITTAISVSNLPLISMAQRLKSEENIIFKNKKLDAAWEYIRGGCVIAIGLVLMSSIFTVSIDEYGDKITKSSISATKKIAKDEIKKQSVFIPGWVIDFIFQ